MSGPDTAVGGRYRLVSRIATGGMGTVWEAWDERLQRRVALKQLHPQPGLSPAETQVAADRALREARITARLHHPHAVPVYDVVDHDGQPCLVMQYLPAKSLQALISEQGPLGVAEVARIGSEVASALDAAHRVGIVHRDVKPGNVLIDQDGTAKLTDFGISHALGDATLTSAGMVTGTPAYLAPEVARGAPSSAASDVFSLGATLYTALEGTSPVGSGENAMATLHRVASGQMTPPRRGGPLTPLLERMLAVDPARRPSMAEVTQVLGELRRHALDPRAGATTQHLAPMAPPPSATVVLPPAVGPVLRSGPPLSAPPPSRPGAPAASAPEEPPRSRRGLVAALAVVVLAVAGLVAFLVSQAGGTSNDTAGGPATSPATHRTSPSHPATHSTHRPSPSPTPRSSTGSSGSVSQAASTRHGPPAAGGDPAQAVTHYYELLPGNTDAAWQLLTPHFQRTRAGGRATYDQYWASMRSVSATGARDAGPRKAVATINYVYRDGRHISETTTFTFKDEGGVLKIDKTS